MVLEKIRKRDGIIVDYDKTKISTAIFKAAKSCDGNDQILANELADKVEDYLTSGKTQSPVPSVDEIQDAVEKILIESGHSKTAKAFILYRDKRDRVRDANSQLLSTIRDLTLEDSRTMDLKRENGNIDGNSTMGTMLRYGSEASKRFTHLNLLRPEHSRAHLSGLIHIHDLDFYPLTLNCVPEDTYITITDYNGENISRQKISYFNRLFVYEGNCSQAVNLSFFKYSILSKDGNTTKIKSVMRRKLSPNELLYTITLNNSNKILKVTANHLVPVFEGKKVIYVKAKNLKQGFYLKDPENNLLEITNITSSDKYNGYVYDLETADHHFIANGVLVHNCVQIDLAKLFKGGFNTGFGKLREPADIRSAGSLAAIAIQSDQNDMFK